MIEINNQTNSINSLSLEGNYITQNNAILIMGFVVVNPRIKELDLSDNLIHRNSFLQETDFLKAENSKLFVNIRQEFDADEKADEKEESDEDELD